MGTEKKKKRLFLSRPRNYERRGWGNSKRQKLSSKKGNWPQWNI